MTTAHWDKVWQRREQRKAERREHLRQAVAISDVPLPPELAEAVINLNDKCARIVLRHHPGFPLAERRDSYLISVAIVEQSFEDLLAAICNFENAAVAEDSTLISGTEKLELKRFERQIQKELFAAANSAASLVDHARRVDKCCKLQEYDAKRVECFGTDGLHEFVIELRVLLYHVHVIEVGWNMTISFSEGTKTATFVIPKEVIKRVINGKGNASARVLAYVDAASDNIDLRTIFLDYRARMAKFHTWMKNELTSDSLIALRDYDRLIQQKVNSDRRIFWKAMMGNWLSWQTPPNPHRHLPRFLLTEQLQEVYKLPRNSKAQVDLVISYMDKNNAIDDALREQAYVLFERSGDIN